MPPDRSEPPTAPAPTLQTAAYLRLISMPGRTGRRDPSEVPGGQQLCYSDAYARSVEARILAVETEPSPAVLLDSTVFYPGGSGQTADTGAIIRAAAGATEPGRLALKSARLGRCARRARSRVRWSTSSSRPVRNPARFRRPARS